MHTTAIMGCAHIHTPGFIRRINARSDVSAKYVWDHVGERAENTARQLGADLAANVEEILSDREIESVVVCSETNRHLQLVNEIVKAGKHLFVEKPLGMGAADAYAMADAIEGAGVIFQTGYFMRGDPIHRFIREHIVKGSFGTITRMRHTNFHAGSLKDMFTPEWLWMTNPKEAGIGAFGDLGTHSLDILMWLLGDISTVTATLESVTGLYGDLDETGEALLRFKSGVIGSLAGGWVDVAHPIPLIVSGTEGHACVVDGKLYFKSDHVDGADGREPWTDLPDPWPHAFELFFDAVAAGKDVSLVTPREAADRSAVMEALYKADSRHAWIDPAAPADG